MANNNITETRLIEGLFGNEGETEGSIAIIGITNPSPHYPDQGRLVIGSPPVSRVSLAQLNCSTAKGREFAAAIVSTCDEVDAAIAAAKANA